MKKNIKLMGLLLMAGMAFTACSSDDAEEQASQQGDKTWTATMDVAKELGTRTLIISGTSLNVGWNTSEKVYVYRNNTLVGTLSPSSITSASSVAMTGTLTGNSYVQNNEVQLIFPRAEVDYSGQDGTLATIAANYDYATGTTTVSNVSGNSLTFLAATLTSQQAIIKFTLPWAVKMLSIYGNANMMSEPIVVVPASATSTLYAAVPLNNNLSADYVVTVVRASDNREVVVKKTGIQMENGKYYTCTFTDGEMETPTYFNLGLSRKWYAYNLDLTATSKLTLDVTKTGSKLAWGEFSTKSEYSQSTYKYYNTTTGKYTKYVNSSTYGTVDNLTVLQATDDAANVANSNYHMPTEQEAEELFDTDKCFRTEFTMDGEKYVLVTSKVSGRQGNAIIFRAENDAYQWTSTLSSSTPSAIGYRLVAGDGSHTLALFRPYDYEIRPVRSN